MNKEDFVSLEMAKILKDKGFDSPIFYECCMSLYYGR